MNINLSEEEVVYLHNILERELFDTKSEIHHSDNFNFKDDLKKQIRFLQDILNKMNVAKVEQGKHFEIY